MDRIIIEFTKLDKEVLGKKLDILDEELPKQKDFVSKIEILRDKIYKSLLEMDKDMYDSD